MATEESSEILSLKQQLVEKDQQLARLRDEKNSLEENLDEQEDTVKEIRKTFQKRIDELTNVIEEKDEQIDSMSEEIVHLKNNNQTQEVGGSATPETINSLKEQIRLKDMSISEMKEKLNKGGMTINNLHMEIRELKEDISDAKESISDKSAKIKEMRDEISQLKLDNFKLQQKTDSETTNSEESQSLENSGGIVKIEVLKKEVERKNEELMSMKNKLKKYEKELNDIKQKQIPIEAKSTHSEEKTETLTISPDDYILMKTRNTELQQQLENAQLNFWKTVVGFAVLVLAYGVTSWVYT